VLAKATILPSAPDSTPLTAQVVSTSGQCWSATFETGDVRHSGINKFRASLP
jgi:hypothetical protein